MTNHRPYLAFELPPALLAAAGLPPRAVPCDRCGTMVTVPSHLDVDSGRPHRCRHTRARVRPSWIDDVRAVELAAGCICRRDTAPFGELIWYVPGCPVACHRPPEVAHV